MMTEKTNTQIFSSPQVGRMKAQLDELLADMLRHDGFGRIEIDMKILKRGQKEVLIRCGKEYRYVVDFANPGRVRPEGATGNR